MMVLGCMLVKWVECLTVQGDLRWAIKIPIWVEVYGMFEMMENKYWPSISGM